MTRLGSVLGAILADLGRARVVADQLTRDLVDEYRSDPILSSMSVPRVVFDQVELTLRFTVAEIAEAPASAPTEAAHGDDWARNIRTVVLPELLGRSGLTDAQREAALGRLAGTRGAPASIVPAAAVRHAQSGKFDEAAEVVAKTFTKSFKRLPADIVGKIGTEAAFRRELAGRLAKSIPSWVAVSRERDDVRAALASRIDVRLQSDDVPAEAHRVQEIRLTVRGEDVSTILNDSGGA